MPCGHESLVQHSDGQRQPPTVRRRAYLLTRLQLAGGFIVLTNIDEKSLVELCDVHATLVGQLGADIISDRAQKFDEYHELGATNWVCTHLPERALSVRGLAALLALSLFGWHESLLLD